MNVRQAVPIGGASLVQPTGLSPEKRAAGWTLIQWLTSPEKSGWWSRATGYFAPNKAAYDLPEMKAFLEKNPDAKIAVDQLANAKPWFATYRTVPVRKAPPRWGWDACVGMLPGGRSSRVHRQRDGARCTVHRAPCTCL